MVQGQQDSPLRRQKKTSVRFCSHLMVKTKHDHKTKRALVLMIEDVSV